MTGQELYELNTEIRGGRSLDEVTFYILLNLAKATFERMRAWRKLVKKDTSKISTSGTTGNTPFALPADFIMTLPRRTLKLVSGSSHMDYTEVPFERWDEYKEMAGNFCIDHLNNTYYVGGSVGTNYTHSFSYIGTSADITEVTSWIFPAEFHPALAFEVAAMDELGMDYDDINARQGSANIARGQIIMRSAIKYDDALQRSALGA